MSHLLGHEFSTFGLGEYGVSGFFMLSGFVLSVAYGRKIEADQFLTRSFFLKQWAKLYPLHITTFLLGIAYEAHYGNFYEWFRLVPPVFLVQSWIPNEWFHYIPNGSSWSLCAFFFFYTLFSFAYMWIHRLSLHRLLALLSMMLVAYFVVVLMIPERFVYAFFYPSPLMRLPEFILGIALCRLMRSKSGKALASAFETRPLWQLTTSS